MEMGKIVLQIISATALVLFIYLLYTSKAWESPDNTIKYPAFIILSLLVGNALLNIIPSFKNSLSPKH
jgi:hypothetical protein